MEEKTASPKLVATLQKLLALANDKGATEGEASAAMAKVQELLATYNLSMAEIESRGASSGDEGKREERKRGGAMYNYQRSLMEAVAAAYYCSHFIFEGKAEGHDGKERRIKQHRLIGRQANVVAANLMYDYLNSTINSLVREVYPGANMSKSAVSWKEGCADRLISRLEERRREIDEAQEAAARKTEEARKANAPASGPVGTGLVLLSDIRGTEEDLNNDFRYGWEPGTTLRRRNEWAARQVEDEKAEKVRREALGPEGRKAEDEANLEKRRKLYEQWTKEARRGRSSSGPREREKDWSAYEAGSERGKSVGLDPQVSRRDTKRIG